MLDSKARKKILETFKQHKDVLLPPDIDARDVERLCLKDFRYKEHKGNYAFLEKRLDDGAMEYEIEFTYLSTPRDFILHKFLLEEILEGIIEATKKGYTATAIYYAHNKRMQQIAPKIARLKEPYYVWTYRSPDVKDFSQAPEEPFDIKIPVPEKISGYEILSYNGLFLSFYFHGIPDLKWIRNMCWEFKVPYFAVFSPYPSLSRKTYVCQEIEFQKEKVERYIEICNKVLNKERAG